MAPSPRSPYRPLRWLALWRALAWLAVGVVVVLALLPEPPDPVPVAHSDKLYHLLGYALLAGAWAQVWAAPALWWRLAGLALLGLALEGVQALLPWRSADGWDALANAAGVAIAAGLSHTRLVTLLQRLEEGLGRARHG